MGADFWMELPLSQLRVLYRDRLADLEFEYNRAERAEAALAAVPWQALLNIAASDAANDPDEAALLSFLNRYAPWVPPSDNDLLSPDQEGA